jgi:ribosome recycling factor
MEWIAWALVVVLGIALVLARLELSDEKVSVKWRDEWIDSLKKSKDRFEEERDEARAQRDEFETAYRSLWNQLEQVRKVLAIPPEEEP